MAADAPSAASPLILSEAPRGAESKDTPLVAPLAMTGCVLAGGRSSRMGRDKAWLRVAPGAPPLVAVQVERLRRIFERVLVSANDPAAFAPLEVEVVPDRGGEGAGPLAGIAAAVAAARTPYVFCCAVDLPFLCEPLVRYLASLARGEVDVVVPRGVEGAAFEPLHAVYGRRCLEPFDRRLAASDRKIDRAFADPALAVRVVEPAEVARFDPERRSFRNVNTPAELEAAAREWREQRGTGGSSA